MNLGKVQKLPHIVCKMCAHVHFSREGLCGFCQVHSGLCDPSYTRLLLGTSIEAELEGFMELGGQGGAAFWGRMCRPVSGTCWGLGMEEVFVIGLLLDAFAQTPAYFLSPL